MRIAIFLLAAGAALAQHVATNLSTAKWTHEKNDPPGSESVLLREDPQTGGMDLLVRFPAGHVIAPHWHSANERLIVAEGKVSVRRKRCKQIYSALDSKRACPRRFCDRRCCDGEGRGNRRGRVRVPI